MSNSDKILAEFSKLGYNQNSYLKEPEINRALDTIAAQNAGFSLFDRGIAEELWGHCHGDEERGVKLIDYVSSINEAESILRKQAILTSNALVQTFRPQQKSQLQEQYNQILSDHHIISSPFRLTPLSLANLPTQMAPQPLGQQGNPTLSHPSESLSQQPQSNSQDLRIVLFIGLALLAFELVLMFHKHHFLNLLCILGILSIFAMNYFDRDYLRFLLVFVFVTIVYDIAWLAVNAPEYWNPNPLTQHSTLHPGFLAFIDVMVVLLIVLKLVVFWLLLKYRDNPETIRKNVSAFGYKIKLDGHPKNNPFSPLLKSTN